MVGLGNPGASYDETRHNVGMEIVRFFANKRGWKLRRAASFSGEMAQGSLGDRGVLLLLPLTYMNSSGEAVRLCKDYFKVPLENVLVVCDDIALPFGRLRLKPKGSSGGHNGLKSVESHLGSDAYARLRVGVGAAQDGNTVEHVLGRFTKAEKEALPAIIERAEEAVGLWLLEGIESAMRTYNVSETVEE